MTYTANIIPTMTSATEPSGVVTSSDYVGASYDWKAFDHSNVDDICWQSGPANFPKWLEYQFAVAKTITQYTLTSRNYQNVRAPKTWTFEGSNNGTTWVTLDTQTDITDWAASLNTQKTFPLLNTTAYLYYRLHISATNDVSGYVCVGELEMMETLAIPIRSGRFPVISRICRGM